MSNLGKRAASIVKRTASTAVPIQHHPAIAATTTQKRVVQEQHDAAPVKPYSKIPGPWGGIPFIGNSWRFAPFIGKKKKKGGAKIINFSLKVITKLVNWIRS